MKMGVTKTDFKIEDITAEAKSYSYEVDDNIWRLGKIKKQSKESEILMGEQCNYLYECWYVNCGKNINQK